MRELDWPRLGRYVRARRIQIGHKARDGFAEKAGVGTRTVGQLERGLPVGDNTLYAVEHTLLWSDGAAQSILRGGEPEISDPRFAGLYPIRPEPDGEIDRPPVGRGGDSGEVLRPDDFTPEEWRELRRYAEFIRSQNPAAQ